MPIPVAFRLVSALLILPLLVGCAGLVSRAGSRFADNLGAAIADADDPATIRDGLPAYLLALDGMLRSDPEDAGMLLAAARLNGAYAGNFVGEDNERAKRLSAKALDYAKRATCLEDQPLCAAVDGDVETFNARVETVSTQRVPLLYGLASAWAGYLQAHRDDWNAIADLPKVEALLRRTVELDPDHDDGLPYVYLGVLNSLRPAAVGGKPEQGRAYFERAIALSDGRNLQAKTLEAEFYARLIFDRELHDRLLTEVLSADPKAPGLTLMNVLAQERAKALQASADEYF